MKKIEGSPKNLRELLQNTKYSIHYYQREYMWQRKHIEENVREIAVQKHVANQLNRVKPARLPIVQRQICLHINTNARQHHLSKPHQKVDY